MIQLYQTTANPAQVLSDVRVLYPNPTIYSDHPILALDADGARLIDALSDPRIQDIAWKKYGFRSAFTPNDVTEFGDLPLAQQFRTIPAPAGDVTLALLGCLEDAARCG